MIDTETYVNIVYGIGKAVTILGGLCIVAVLVIALAYLSNMAQHKALESYGGWKTFLQYREWYQEHGAKAKAEERQG